MPGFVIKDLPDELHRKLKEQAARHHRSMTKEVLAVLEQALVAKVPSHEAPPPFRGQYALTTKVLDKARRDREFPDSLFTKAKATAAEHGQSLEDFFADALREKLGSASAASRDAEPVWMKGFGTLKRLRSETARIQAEIDTEFGGIEAEDRA